MQTFAQSARAAHSSCLLPGTNVDGAEGLSEQSEQFYEAEWNCKIIISERHYAIGTISLTL